MRLAEDLRQSEKFLTRGIFLAVLLSGGFDVKRKGETFTEFLTSATVFGIMMAGLFEFMANQTQSLANIRDRDNLMYHAGRFMTISRDVTGTTNDTQAGVSFDLTSDILTVKNNNASMTFRLKPSDTTP